MLLCPPGGHPIKWEEIIMANEKILVVDDNRELRNLIKEELTGAGYRAVRMADSAAAARQAISGELPDW